MKLISLNIWGAQIYDPLIDFIKLHKEDTDFFTFQEIFKSDRDILSDKIHTNNLEDISKILTEFDYYFSSTNDGYNLKRKVDFPLQFGQATFWNKSLKIENKGEIFVHKKENQIGPTIDGTMRDFPRNFVFTKFNINNKPLLIMNLHGYWEPAPKYDTPQRFKQSQIILDFIKEQNVPTILAGDFNLSPNTLSIGMLDAKLVNLINKYDITNTRSSLYDPKYIDEDKYADYIFTTEDIKVNNFEVLKNEVSDHLPLLLNFDY